MLFLGRSPQNERFSQLRAVVVVVGHVPQGLHVVKVGTLDEAYDALVAIRDGKGGSLPQCTVKQ